QYRGFSWVPGVLLFSGENSGCGPSAATITFRPPIRLAPSTWDHAGLADLGPHAGWRTLMTSPISANIRALTLTLALAFLVTSIGAAYWTVLASDQLANDPFNPRLIAATNNRPRGAIVDRNGAPIATSEKTDSGFARYYKDRTLTQVVGYASAKFGLSGIEAAYADSLIGQDPADPVSIWKARYLGDRAPAGQVVLGID